MEGSAAGFAERLFGSQNQIAIMDHLAEWTRLHLDARFASASCMTTNANVCESSRNGNLRLAFSTNSAKFR